jgi:hypothetical protein
MGTQVLNSGVGGKAASHFVVEASEPNGPIRVARTYFFSAFFLPVVACRAARACVAWS